MLLIVSNSSDATVAFAEPEILATGQRYWRLDTDVYPHESQLIVRREGAVINTATRQIALDDVRVIWWRRPVPPRIRNRDEAVNRWASEEARLALDGALRTVDAHWINHPDHNRVAQDKVNQLRRAESLGFAVPDWVLTNRPDTALEFVQSQPDGVVAKPLHGGQIDPGRTFWTTRLELRDVAFVGPEPYLLQRFVKRANDIRVTVVGDEVFAVAIDASGRPEGEDDWRRVGRDAHHEIVDLDTDTQARCLALARHFGLSFAAVDLAFDGQQTWFFEVNPNGQWAWLEEAVGVSISASLARLFAHHG